MIRSILVLCVGNICRSPVGERLLRARLARIQVMSAGIAALAGRPADGTMTEVANEHALSLDGHVARQFTAEIGAGADLLLVMEIGHKREIARLAPQLAGRTMLYDQWTGAKGIADPYRHPREVHEATFDQLAAAADAWADRLMPRDMQ